MSSFDPILSQTTTKSATLLPSAWLLSLATMPMLIGLISAKALAVAAQTLGEQSEEIFRGDRLPAIDLPTTPPVDGND